MVKKFDSVRIVVTIDGKPYSTTMAFTGASKEMTTPEEQIKKTSDSLLRQIAAELPSTKT